MKLKQLEQELQRLATFSKPNVQLEQYPTPGHIAAQFLFQIGEIFDDFRGKTVLDLGTGGGQLGIGAALMGCDSVVGVDVDEEALEIARKNIKEAGVDGVMELLLADVLASGSGLSATTAAPVIVGAMHGFGNDDDMWPRSTGNFFFHRRFDTVIMNPPFGTRRKGADLDFLLRAIEHCRGAVYSLFKSSTREHVLRKCRSWGFEASIVGTFRFNIPAMYEFHTHDTLDVEIDMLRVDVRKQSVRAIAEAATTWGPPGGRSQPSQASGRRGAVHALREGRRGGRGGRGRGRGGREGEGRSRRRQ